MYQVRRRGCPRPAFLAVPGEALGSRYADKTAGGSTRCWLAGPGCVGRVSLASLASVGGLV